MAVNFSCDWRVGFVPDPADKQRRGYLVRFNGLDMGEFLKQDLNVVRLIGSPSYPGLRVDSTDKVTCVGVLESFSWSEGVTDPLCISAYISAENADELGAKLQTTLKTTQVTNLAWWIYNYDEETKAWFEESFPKSADTVAGQLNAPGGDVRIRVAPVPTKVAQNVDVSVFHVYVEVVPAPYQVFDLHFATSSKTNIVRKWGHLSPRDPRQDPRFMQP